jgi:lipoprotein-anchoring transpeptidase ErfK/SrfK
MRWVLTCAAAVVAMVGADLGKGAVRADPLGFHGPFNQNGSAYEQVSPNTAAVEDSEDVTEVPARLRRQVVDYPMRENPGTIVIDTPNTYLYFVIGGGRAIRYGIGVGREGFSWSGVKFIERKAEWPDWYPPADMLVRQPYLPRFMAGGPGNPLGARAMYLGGTLYRIHGTNEPDTIGKFVSSGCVRLMNEDVIDLYSRVNVGAKVIVLPMQPSGEMSMTEGTGSPALSAPNAAANLVRASGLY